MGFVGVPGSVGWVGCWGNGARVVVAGRGRRRAGLSGRVRMQGFSDSKPREEYFDFLSTGKAPGAGAEVTEEDNVPAVIVGGRGRIGSLLASLGAQSNRSDLVLTSRDDPIPESHPGPVFVATRNDALAHVIETQCPPSKRDDLVFLQNGFLEPALRRYALLDDSTRVNAYFAVPAVGAPPVDGITRLSPDGLTSATGKWAPAVAARLAVGGLRCHVQHARDFRRAAMEKWIWICVMNLIGAVHGGITVGEVAAKHRREVEDMTDELARVVRFSLTVALFPGLVDRLCAYAESVADFKTAVKEFEWRNGWFYKQSVLAKENGFDHMTPMHTDYLVDGKARGLIDW